MYVYMLTWIIHLNICTVCMYVCMYEFLLVQHNLMEAITMCSSPWLYVCMYVCIYGQRPLHVQWYIAEVGHENYQHGGMHLCIIIFFFTSVVRTWFNCWCRFGRWRTFRIWGWRTCLAKKCFPWGSHVSTARNLSIVKMYISFRFFVQVEIEYIQLWSVANNFLIRNTDHKLGVCTLIHVCMYVCM